jgi:glycosyltransferase involved in cell wall biosynthesis
MEGTPVAIIEAQAAAVPVISTYHAGIPDVVIDKVTGFLVEEKDVDAMTKAMIHIFSDKKIAEEMGEKARKNIRAHFTMAQHIDILNKALKEIAIA